MKAMLTAPIDHPVNLTMQAVLTYASWSLTVVLLVIAIRFGLRERTPFYLILVLAALVGAFAEPLYDAGMMLWFYAPGMWTHFTAFGIPQPVWTHSGYVVLYGSAALFISHRIHAGTLTRAGLYAWALAELAMSCTFEMVGINGGAYEYWGPHTLRVFEYPIVIGVLETAQVMCFAVVAARLRQVATHRVALLALFALFPVTFFGANFGAGAPLIIALHLDTPNPTWVLAGTLASIGSALLLVHLAAGMLPNAARARLPAHAPLAAATR